MRVYSLFLALLMFSANDWLIIIVADDVASDTQSLQSRILSLQNETQSLCSHIEQSMLFRAKNFKATMDNAHKTCPDYQTMEPMLTNMEKMARQHHHHVELYAHGCQELSKMLTNGLENGNLVTLYLREGNYSLVTMITDKWHESFTKFHATFYATKVPLRTIQQNSKIFYYDSWGEGIRLFVITVLVPLTVAIALTAIVFWIGSVLGWIKALHSAIQGLHQTKSFAQVQSPLEQPIQTKPAESSTARRRKQHGQGNLEEENTSEHGIFCEHDSTLSTTATVDQTSASPRFTLLLTISLFLFLLCMSMVVGVLLNPSAMFIPKAVRYNWYPDIESALASMDTDIENLYTSFSHQVDSITEIRRHVSMYHDKTVQAVANALVRDLVRGLRQTSKELANAYSKSEKLPTTFRRTYERIEGHAKKAGQLAVATDLLRALNETADQYQILHRSLAVSVIHQKKVLPILKEQTQSMRALVHEDRLVELGIILPHHQDALIEIDGTIYDVHLRTEQILGVLDSESTYGMKKTIVSLKDDTIQEQVRAMLVGGIGGTTGTVAGALAVKTGYAMATVTATTVAGPAVAFVGGLGLIGLGVYSAVHSFNSYTSASLYKNELAALEIERLNLKVAIEQLQEAIESQQQAIQSSQSSLGRLIEHTGRFSKISGFVLNAIQRSAINDELVNLVTEYNRMIAVYSLFTLTSSQQEKEPALT